VAGQGWPATGAAEGAVLSSQRKQMTPILVFIFYWADKWALYPCQQVYYRTGVGDREEGLA
jgi:hypothetical protein